MFARGFYALFAGAVLLFSTFAHAQLGDYTNSPESNSSDWELKISQLGAIVNKNINFEGHAPGVLQGEFYTSSDGVTLTVSGDVNEIRNGTGPGQGNTDEEPLSPGEGPHAASNYLYDGGSASSLTISFATPVWGAGLFTIDHFNPFDTNPLTIEAFDGPDGTGVSLGLVTSAAFNYQPDNVYFMGVTSDSGNISSIVFTDVNGATGDTMGLDDIWFASHSKTVPVPSTGLVAKLTLIFAFILLATATYKRRRI